MTRFGLIGCGGIGRLRAAALQGVADSRLVAVCDLLPERAGELANQHGAVAVAGPREMLDRVDVDAVIVSTLPSSHRDLAVSALEAGKHVLIEKPMARSSAECREILAAAERHGGTVAVGFNFRFYPPVKLARALLRQGRIGELDHVRSYAGYSAEEHPQNWLHDAAEMGGGVMRDNGIHLIDVTQYLLGDVADVVGMGSNGVFGFDGCEDNAITVLRNSAGKLGSLHASWTEWRGYRFEVEVYGTLGCIRLSCFPMRTEVRWREARGRPWRREVHRFLRDQVMEKLKTYTWVVERSFREELSEFLRAIQGDESKIATGAEGLRSIEIAEAAAVPRGR